MKIFKIFISIIFLSYIGIKYSFAEDCGNFEKLSKEYVKCNAKLLKKNTENLKINKSEKTESLQKNTTTTLEEGKKKIYK